MELYNQKNHFFSFSFLLLPDSIDSNFCQNHVIIIFVAEVYLSGHFAIKSSVDAQSNFLLVFAKLDHQVKLWVSFQFCWKTNFLNLIRLRNHLTSSMSEIQIWKQCFHYRSDENYSHLPKNFGWFSIDTFEQCSNNSAKMESVVKILELQAR